MKFRIPKNVSKFASKAILKVRKASPAILVVVGVGAMIGGTYLACKASREIDEPLEEAKKTIDEIHEKEETDKEFAESKDCTRAKLGVYTDLAKKMGKLYGPAFIVMILGVVSIFGGYNMLNQRYIGLAAAYSALSKEALISHAKLQSEVSKAIDPKTGEVKKESVKKFAPEIEYYYSEPDENSLTPMGAYAFKFIKDECWGAHNSYGVDYCVAVSNIKYLREKLKSCAAGFLFFDECYSQFGYKIRDTKDGRQKLAMSKCVGWMRQEGKDIEFNGTRRPESFDPKMITAYDPIILPSGEKVWEKYIIIDPMSFDPNATYFGPIIDMVKA